MQDEPSPFGLLHAIGLAIAGCLAFALFTDEWLWTGIALAAALALAVWGGIVAHRQFGGDEDWPRF